ncbi:peptidylprolyl isomerase [Limisalsivibrio acetivorans]|uniref:peptidylprolyl isomerase n=1 Tax=Limisalsivibrio acetivorans TaxID=1304888 RepID=UPI0003B4DF31|nr:peptidylprolyl isomerase [Limisalsivibrio acetivorans]
MTFRLSIFLLSVLLLMGCGPEGEKEVEKQVKKEKKSVASESVVIETTYGDIKLELYPEKAPKTVENFMNYVNSGFYDGTTFHRVIPGFMIQGGGFTEEYDKKPTNEPIENEADNGLKNERGTIAMARTPDPHSASSQFFINVADNDFLNYSAPTPRGYGYAVFGRVTEGMDVVDKIVSVKTGSIGPFPKDAPLEPVIIKTIK